MPITIDIFERTGDPFTDEEVTNNNWKNDGLLDSLYKYYYYPIRRPEDPVWVKHSVTKYIYATITGTFELAKRVRWKITGLGLASGCRLYLGQTENYVEPTDAVNGALVYGNTDPLYIYPNISTVGPTSATSRDNALVNPAGTTTYYTDFLCTQLWVDDTDVYVGNTDTITFQLELDEYE